MNLKYTISSYDKMREGTEDIKPYGMFYCKIRVYVSPFTRTFFNEMCR